MHYLSRLSHGVNCFSTVVLFNLSLKHCSQQANFVFYNSLKLMQLRKINRSTHRVRMHTNWNNKEKVAVLLKRSRFFNRCRCCMSACRTSGPQWRSLNTELRRRIQSLLLAKTSVRPAN